MTYIKINSTLYPTINISGKTHDATWDNRESKEITLSINYEQAAILFVDDIVWSIVQENVIQSIETGENEVTTCEFDNSGFSVAGDIIDHRDGTISIKMGKPTALEIAYELLYGGEA